MEIARNRGFGTLIHNNVHFQRGRNPDASASKPIPSIVRKFRTQLWLELPQLPANSCHSLIFYRLIILLAVDSKAVTHSWFHLNRVHRTRGTRIVLSDHVSIDLGSFNVIVTE